LEVKPTQVTLVPDAPDAITSNAGWDTLQHKDFLTDIITQLRQHSIRSSLFIGTDAKMVAGAAEVGAERVELYTEPYEKRYAIDPKNAVAPFIIAARQAIKLGMAVNAGHDLKLANLHFFVQCIPQIAEVSIGHALICDALYYGLENTIQMYLRKLN
jgi:pyridoxine 5-phosphate synthase